MKVLEDQTTPVTEGFPGKTLEGKPPVPLPKFKPALFVFQLDYGNLMKFSDRVYFSYVPSLSCYEKPVQQCDQDVGDYPLPFNSSQCILLINPTATPVRFNLSMSFTKSVFVQEFTSPKTPGGTSSSSAISLYKFEFGDNLITILSSILIYNVIGTF